MARHPPPAAEGGPLAPALDLFLSHLRVEKGLAANSVEAYARDIRRYIGHLEASGRASWSDVARGDVQAHLAEVYGTDVSRDTISRITDTVVAGATASCAYPFTVKAAAATSFLLTSSTTTTRTGDSFNVTITAKDQYGNTALYNGAVTLAGKTLVPPPNGAYFKRVFRFRPEGVGIK